MAAVAPLRSLIAMHHLPHHQRRQSPSEFPIIASIACSPDHVVSPAPSVVADIRPGAIALSARDAQPSPKNTSILRPPCWPANTPAVLALDHEPHLPRHAPHVR
ncbi:hypothetical protein BD626DRAFT_495480 [Schizophyllum amplum]|uniref:Uncharacterized protein n=1 Tax=Schizophyllum amplum TaxID=97359 RepID=A0A550CE67_9AGAR|nr:hypothetical protein BD626DRAFT_495480 [Auriculariopsis ampla]